MVRMTYVCGEENDLLSALGRFRKQLKCSKSKATRCTAHFQGDAATKKRAEQGLEQ